MILHKSLFEKALCTLHLLPKRCIIDKTIFIVVILGFYGAKNKMFLMYKLVLGKTTILKHA